MLRRSAVPLTRRRAALATIAAAFCFAVPSTASAATAEISNVDVEYVAGVGEENNVDIFESATDLIINDTEGVSPGPGCDFVNANRVSCPLADFNAVHLDVGNSVNVVHADQDSPIYINGQTGLQNDFVTLGSGYSTLSGGAGTDHLQAGSGGSFVRGFGGKDTLVGGSGNDDLQGGDGNDVIRPGFGDDEIYGQGDVDSVDYSNRFVPLDLSIDDSDNDGAPGEQDNIHIGTERIFGGQAGDDIVGSGDRDLIEANGGNDTVRTGGGDDEVSGGSGNDDLRTEAGVDFANGGDDQDVIDGGGQGDLLIGGAGNDEIDGAQGDDQLSGGLGDDHILGAIGDDEVQGNEGNDTLDGGQGSDNLTGQAGNDTVDYSANAAPLTVDLDGSTDDDGVENEGDTVGADVENVNGGSGSDKITGNASQNVLIGAQGNDTIEGGDNNDTLIGASGSDTLLSKDGVLDIVDCGIESDTFDSDPVDTLIDCESPVMKQDDGNQEQPKEDQKQDDQKVDPIKPALRIGPGSARVSRSRLVKLSVSCPVAAPDACVGTLRLQRKAKGKVNTLGRKGFKVPAGSKRKITIRVSKSTAKSVARKPLKVNAAAKATAGASDASRKVTLKRAKRSKR